MLLIINYYFIKKIKCYLRNKQKSMKTFFDTHSLYKKYFKTIATPIFLIIKKPACIKSFFLNQSII